MSTTVFDGSVVGPVLDADSGDIVAYVGVGNLCVITNWALAAGSSYLFRNLVQVFMPVVQNVIMPPGSSVAVEGDLDSKTTFTTVVGVWTGFRMDSDTRLNLDHVIIKNCDPDNLSGYAGIISVGTPTTRTGDHSNILVVCKDVKFDEGNRERVLDFFAKDNCLAYFSQCQFIKDAQTGETVRDCLFVRGHASAVDRPVGQVVQSTIFWRSNSPGAVVNTFNANNADIMIVDSIVTQENIDGVQLSRVATVSSGGTVVSLGFNDVFTYVEAQDLGSLVLLATDQTVDPFFADSTLPGVDLRPLALGTLVNSIGWHMGALEPISTSGVSALGSSALYGEIKQRIYEKSFGLNGTRGRGIRVRLTSTDRKSLKTFAGLWVRHTREEPR